MGFANKFKSFLRKNRETIENAKEKYDDREEPQESLVPIGGDFYATPDTPADPTDCNRYPDSPWCGGNPIDATPLAIGWDIVQDDCNFGVQFSGTLLFIKLPPLQIVHRNPNCQLPSPPPPEFPPVANNDCARNVCNDGRIITTVWRRSDAIVPYPNKYTFEFYNDAQKISNFHYDRDIEALDYYLSFPLPEGYINQTITIDSVGARYNRERGIEIYPDGFLPNLPPNSVFLVKNINQYGETSIIEDTFTKNEYNDYVGNIEFCHYYYRLQYDYPIGSEMIHADAQFGSGWIVTRFKKIFVKYYQNRHHHQT